VKRFVFISIFLLTAMGCGGDAATVPMMTNVTPEVRVPEAIVSRAMVRFEVSGGAGHVVYRGRSCRTFEIEHEVDGSWQRVALDLGFSCVCECPTPGAPLSIGLRPISSSVYSEVWDGRQMATVQRNVDCSTRSFSARGVVAERVGNFQPMPAGRYRVSFAIVDTVPPQCMNLMDGYWCPPTSTVGAPEAGAYALCPGRRVSATFDLPETGRVTVPVSVQ
jgi:hypothetical protein